MPEIGVIIQGAKDGFKIMYVSESVPEEDKMFIGYDIRTSSPSEKAIGKECYGLSFSPGGKVFTKYRAMYDAPRNMAVGFLGISLFVPLALKGDGKTIKELLDDLMVGYCLFTEGNKLGMIKEDWKFIQNLLDLHIQYFKSARSQTKSFLSGSEDAAYMHYDDDESLYKFMEDTNYALYKNYRQILLVARNESEILLALKRGDNISGEIEALKQNYTVNIDATGVDVRVTDRNGSRKTEVSKEEILRVTFSKNYFDSISEEGTYFELCEKKPEIFKIHKNTYTFQIIAPVLIPIKKEIRVQISNGNNFIKCGDGIRMTCTAPDSTEGKQITKDCKVQFEGEELGWEWTIRTEVYKKYEASSYSFFPGLHGLTIIPITLIYKKSKAPEENPQKEKNSSVSMSVSHGQFRGSWFKENKRVLGIFGIALSFVALMSTLAYILVTPPSPYQSSQQNQQPTKTEEPPTVLTSYDTTMLIGRYLQYTQGMELYLDSLVIFNTRLIALKYDTNQPSYLQMTNAIRLRIAIDKGNKNEITYAYRLKLSSEQKAFLKFITTDGNFDLFKNIGNRNKLSFIEINNKVNEAIAKAIQEDANSPSEDEAEIEKSNNPAEEIKKRPSDTYKFEEFMNKVRSITDRGSLATFDVNKMDDDQKQLFQLIQDHFGEFKNIKRIKGKDQLSSLQLKEEIKKKLKPAQ